MYTLLLPTIIILNNVSVTKLNNSISEKVLEKNCENFKQNFKEISSLGTCDKFEKYRLDLIHVENTAIDFLKNPNLITNASSNIFSDIELNTFTTIYLTAVFRLVCGIYSDYYISSVSSLPQNLVYELFLINNKFVNECNSISRNPLPQNLVEEFSLLRSNLIFKGGLKNCNKGESDYLSGLQTFIEIMRYNNINKFNSMSFIQPHRIINEIDAFNFWNPKFCLEDISINIFENKIYKNKFQMDYLNFNREVDTSILEKQNLVEKTKYDYLNPILAFSLCSVGVLLYRNICY